MKQKILIVDDNKDSLYLLKSTLKTEGYSIVTARNGKEALEKLENEDIFLIISDILMPVMDGYQLCINCQTYPELKDIPFVFYTATYTEKEDEELAYNVGADLFIAKPIDPKDFLEKIKNTINDFKKGRKKAKIEHEKIKDNIYKDYSERVALKLEEKVHELDNYRVHLEDKVKKRTEALEKNIEILDTSMKVFVGREQKIIKLQDRIQELERELQLIKKEVAKEVEEASDLS